MVILETIAVISTIMCVILTAQQKISCWFFGIISVLSLIGVYVIEGLYAQILLQTVFLVQCIIGWWNWGSLDNLVVNKLGTSKSVINLLITILFGIGLGQLDIIFNNRVECIPSYIDGVSACLALLGNWYLTKKIIQSWLLFMGYNLLITILLLTKDMYLLAVMNSVLFFISLNGYLTWKKDLKKV